MTMMLYPSCKRELGCPLLAVLLEESLSLAQNISTAAPEIVGAWQRRIERLQLEGKGSASQSQFRKRESSLRRRCEGKGKWAEGTQFLSFIQSKVAQLAFGHLSHFHKYNEYAYGGINVSNELTFRQFGKKTDQCLRFCVFFRIFYHYNFLGFSAISHQTERRITEFAFVVNTFLVSLLFLNPPINCFPCFC